MGPCLSVLSITTWHNFSTALLIPSLGLQNRCIQTCLKHSYFFNMRALIGTWITILVLVLLVLRSDQFISFSRHIDQSEETERRSENQSPVTVNPAISSSEELSHSEVKILHVLAHVTTPTGPNPLHNWSGLAWSSFISCRNSTLFKA